MRLKYFHFVCESTIIHIQWHLQLARLNTIPFGLLGYRVGPVISIVLSITMKFHNIIYCDWVCIWNKYFLLLLNSWTFSLVSHPKIAQSICTTIRIHTMAALWYYCQCYCCLVSVLFKWKHTMCIQQHRPNCQPQHGTDEEE